MFLVSFKNAVILFIVLLSNITGSYFIGVCDGELLIALGLTVPITVLTISIGTGIGTGAAIYVGYLQGKKQCELIYHFVQSVYLGLGIVLIPVSWLVSSLMGDLVGIFIYDYSLSESVSEYLTIWVLGVPLLFISMVSSQILRALGDLKSYGIVLLIAAGLTLVLEPLFIFGFGIVPALGIRGIGAAFLCSSLGSSIVALGLLTKRFTDITVKTIDFSDCIQHLKKLFMVSKNLILLSAQAPLIKLFLVAVVARNEPIAAAVLGLCFRFEAVFLIPVNAISGCLFTLFPRLLGEGWINKANALLLKAWVTAFMLQTFIALAIFLAMDLLVEMLGMTLEFEFYFRQYFYVVSWSYGFLSISILLSHALNMYGMQTSSLATSLVRNFLCLLPLFLVVQSICGFELAVYVLFSVNVLFAFIYLAIFYSCSGLLKLATCL
ncbi:hypothetical protein L2737_14590 [Shewanella electrodiphila]|uniref:Uncharacterized protein n=1 Tax=Shewanella electrodiphila TaxID=934143 RepID=A0ABT0KSA5_9GAMM|nr:MATE family efflux transporter [Shewanella electrodiphila]MCL1046539.1 hypothetical protein [Shewanella electrodiphila]